MMGFLITNRYCQRCTYTQSLFLFLQHFSFESMFLRDGFWPLCRDLVNSFKPPLSSFAWIHHTLSISQPSMWRMFVSVYFSNEAAVSMVVPACLCTCTMVSLRHTQECGSRAFTCTAWRDVVGLPTPVALLTSCPPAPVCPCPLHLM